jgi:hypothetical protein
MRVLDLFCGAGGASMGYHRLGFEVVGVDINRQLHYPFEFYQADAMEFPLDGFDIIHASPPCQLYTKKNYNWGRKRTLHIEHPDLLSPIRERLNLAQIPYIIENVPGAPLQASIQLCGTMFGLPLIKHRLFETSWPIGILSPQGCNHENVYNPWKGEGRSAEKFREAQQTPWIPTSGGASRKRGDTGDLYNAIPPVYTEWIGQQFLNYLEGEEWKRT